jgi:hypothetical protein
MKKTGRPGILTADTSSERMQLKFRKVTYKSLKSRQQEAFNFQKVSAVLADYGFTTIRLTSDWRGADFIAQHFDGTTFLKVQLKGRCTLDKKYRNRGLYLCFPIGDVWFLYPHDELLSEVLAKTTVGRTKSWKSQGAYSFPRVSKRLRALLDPYRLEAEEARGIPSPRG